MTSVTLLTEKISDWHSFHAVSAATFGFPDFYGANMDAWVDCLSDLQDGDGMSRFELGVGEQLHIHLPAFNEFVTRVPQICAALLECTALINLRYIEDGDVPRLVLVLA